MQRMLGIALALVVSVTACGDDTNQPTKAQFVTQVNAACKPFQEKTAELFETGFPTSEAKVQPFLEKLTPNVEGQVESIKAVDAPKGDEDAVAAIVKAGEATVADLKKATGDQAAATKLFDAEGGENLEDFTGKAKAFGLNDCVDEEDEEDEQPLLDPSTFSSDKQAYVAKADAICKAADDKLAAAEDATFESFPPPLEKWAVFLPAIVEVYGPVLTELKAIPVPAGDEATLARLYTDLGAVLAQFAEAGELAKAGNQAEFDEVIQRAFTESDETDAAQRAYGFQVCGSEDEGEGDEGE